MSEVNFKLGRLKSLNNQNVEISNLDNDCLYFHIFGVDELNNEYSLSFVLVSINEISKLDLSRPTDLCEYIDKGESIFGYNGIFDLNIELKVDAMRYLSDKYVLIVSFKSLNYNGEDIVGNIEIVFKLD